MSLLLLLEILHGMACYLTVLELLPHKQVSCALCTITFMYSNDYSQNLIVLLLYQMCDYCVTTWSTEEVHSNMAQRLIQGKALTLGHIEQG